MEISEQYFVPSTAGAASSGASDVNSQAFMRLLTTQLKNQNPLEPVQDSEFLGQLAQFSALEESQGQTKAIERLADSMLASAGLQSLAQATNLIGKEISYIDPKTENTLLASVRSVTFGQGGIQLELEDGQSIGLGYVVEIRNPGTTTAPPTATAGDEEPGDAATAGATGTGPVGATPVTGSSSEPPLAAARRVFTNAIAAANL
ncbi:MAG: hypothetical protein KDB53_21790 [Planctomycetes bacterium]|nr:hypothetical protein [Planctomycetota bacterium]